MQDTRAEQIYRSLRERIIGGELEAGSQLVTRSLAQDLGSSLAPIREALHRLAVEGIVEHVPGAGAFVRTISRDDLNELYVLRVAIEACAAEEAARQVRDDELEELEEICQAEEELVSQIKKGDSGSLTSALQEKWVTLEERFHTILVDAARNKLLKKVIADHRAQARIFDVQRQLLKSLTADDAGRVISEHRGLVQALNERNSTLAHQLMVEHIQSGRKDVLSKLRQSSTSSLQQ
ncbi:MAG TPA: GntR family transcriptional regulator [Planctomicrobium sp.]|nr:GntR family transcriptional regulator [Planctomicrobium sp.]